MLLNSWGCPRPICFVFEMARAPRHFVLSKGHLRRKRNFCCSISRAPRQWSGGMEAITFVASMKYQAWCPLYPDLFITGGGATSAMGKRLIPIIKPPFTHRLQWPPRLVYFRRMLQCLTAARMFTEWDFSPNASALKCFFSAPINVTLYSSVLGLFLLR